MVRTTMRVSIVVAAVTAALTIGTGTAVAGLGSFNDDDGNPHESAIESIAEAGITKGCNPPANDRFCPDGVVTRGQIAAFLVRAIDLRS